LAGKALRSQRSSSVGIILLAARLDACEHRRGNRQYRHDAVSILALPECPLMTACRSFFLSTAFILASLSISADEPRKNGIPDYRAVPGWAQLPANLKLGQVSAVATDSADRVYVFHRGKQPILV